MNRWLMLVTGLILGGLLGCESAVLVNNDPGSRNPNLDVAQQASYSENSRRADLNNDNASPAAATQPAIGAETKNVKVYKQRDNVD